jgi:hypothetical protein
MTMAIIAADVVHAFTVDHVCLPDGFVKILRAYTFEVKFNILMGFSKCKIIGTYIVWTLKVMNDTFRITNTRMADDWDYLSQTRKWSPCNT